MTQGSRQVLPEAARSRPEPPGREAGDFAWSAAEIARWEALHLPAAPAAGAPLAELSDVETDRRELFRLIAERGADDKPHAVGSFRDHLAGTWQILTAWRQPLALRRLGLYHSFYSTEFYRPQLLAFEERALLREAVGPAAESLAFLFCTLDRRRFAQGLSGIAELPETGGIVHNRHTGQTARIGRETYVAILVAEMANLAEQSGSIADGPGHWMALCSSWAALAAPHLAQVPPVFDACRRRLLDAHEQRARSLYLAATAAATPDVASLEKCIELNPEPAEPRIVLAHALAVRGERAAARGHAEAALALLCAWGTAWDKRRLWLEWLSLATRLASGARA
jgi:hypothetical protein